MIFNVSTDLQLLDPRMPRRCPPPFELCMCSALRARFGHSLFSDRHCHHRARRQEASLDRVRTRISEWEESEEPSHPKTFIVLPLRVKVDDPEVDSPDEGDVQHWVE